MFTINFLNNREIGSKAKPGVRASDLALNLDDLISRFICLKNDVFTVFGEQENEEVPPFACQFRKDSFCDSLAVAGEDGVITLYDTRINVRTSVLNSFSAHHNAIWDISWLPDKSQLVTGSGDTSARLFDMQNSRMISSFMKHTESVKSVDVCPKQSAIFATGSRDGCIYVWDVRDKSCAMDGKPSVSICQAHCRNIPVIGRKQAPKGSISSVSAVAFQDLNHLVSAGVVDGVVKIWDLRKTYIPNPKYLPLPKYRLEYADSKTYGFGCTSLVFDSLYKNLYICTTGNKVFKFNCHLYTQYADVYEGFSCATYFVKSTLSKDDQYLLCGSSDNKAYIWKTTKPGSPIVQLPGHHAEVTAVAWSPYDVTKLVTCGDDNTVAVWKIRNKKHYEKDEIYAAAETYSGNPKNSSPSHEPINQSITTVSDHSMRRKSFQSVQTPKKSTTTTIRSFFTPVTSKLCTNELSHKTSSCQNKCGDTVENNADACSSHVSTDASDASPPFVLKSCNHSLSSSEHNPSSSNKLSCFNTMETSISSSSSVTDKENSDLEISPESFKPKSNLGQCKRKSSPSESCHNLKKSSRSSSNRGKSQNRKIPKPSSWKGKTIINYFSVIPSTEN